MNLTTFRFASVSVKVRHCKISAQPTNKNWKCSVFHHGPVDESCASEASPIPGKGACDFIKTPEPANWKSPDFSVEKWDDAREFLESEVRPKDGYDQVNWAPEAKFGAMT